FAPEDVALRDGTWTRFTPQTPTSRRALEREVARARKRGFAENREEWMPGLVVGAAPGVAAGRMQATLALAELSVPPPGGEEGARRHAARRRRAAHRRAPGRKDDMKVWIDGAIVPASEAKVPVLDHGLLYGDGVFEGIRAYGRAVVRLDRT